MQIFARGLSGKHSVLDVRPWETIAALKSYMEAREGVPASEQRLVYNGRFLNDDSTVETCGISSDSTLDLLLPLLGGKGGFGANLRASGKHKLDDNFDACRDLQGRRIRHKTASDKLEEWQAEAHERELEKVALRHLKEMEKEQQRQEEVVVDIKSVRKASKETLAGVQSAVQYGLKSRNGDGGNDDKKNDGGIKNLEAGAPKRRRMDALLDDGSDFSDSSDEDEEVELPGSSVAAVSGLRKKPAAAAAKKKAAA